MSALLARIKNLRNRSKNEGGKDGGSSRIEASQTLLPVEQETVDRRTLHVLDPAANAAFHFCGNDVSTSRYSWIPLATDFIVWRNLWEQFHKAANVYFLLISIIQIIPGISPTGRYTTLVPLLLVLFITMCKDTWEDWNRRVADRAVNRRKARVFRKGQWTSIQWANVEVGDLILVSKNEHFPADMACLWTSDGNAQSGGICYIETASLDGETNLKLRRACGQAHAYLCRRVQTAADNIPMIPEVSVFRATIACELPNALLYQFEAYLQMDVPDDGQTQMLSRVPLNNDNLLLRGATLRNSRAIIGAVVYTGTDSKLMRNSVNKTSKSSTTEYSTNRQIFYVFNFEMVLCIICTIMFRINLNEYKSHWYLAWAPLTENFDADAAVAFLTFVILLNALIPISLYVMLEAVKLVQAALINNDVKMYYEERDVPAIARSSKLNEDLGQVAYIFSDKTGTLTCNKMEFSRFTCGSGAQAGGAPGNQRQVEAYGGDSTPSPVTASPPSSPTGKSKANWTLGTRRFYDTRISQMQWVYQQNMEEIRGFLIAMALCNTVLPEPDHVGNITYQASSPDEACLVAAAQSLGVELVERTDRHAKIRIESDSITYETLAVVEFSSSRKRMSIVVKDPNGRHVLFTKGADNVILNRLRRDAVSATEQTKKLLTDFASEGLRTLVFARTELNKDSFLNWKRKYDVVSAALQDRTEKMESVAETLERELELIGTTAIEDRLQDNVPHTIELLSKAGIKLWVLTGDKQETAINIGHSCSLIHHNMGMFSFDHCNEKNVRQTMEKYLKEVESAALESGQDIALVIEGSVLEHILPSPDTVETYRGKQGLLSEYDTDLFVSLAEKCKAVICCRVSPIQKAQIVQAVRCRVNGVTLAVGDGANDVSMIQTAHVGVGISGMEGLQAARASDYSIGQFEYLERLLLVHGRWDYRRVSVLIIFTFYKNMSLFMTQFWFCIHNMWTGQTFFDAWALAGYNLAFTAAPIMALAVFDRDVEPRRVLSTKQFPELYLDGLKGRYFNTAEFWLSSLGAIIHSLMCFYLPLRGGLYMFEPSTGRVFGLVGDGIVAYTCILSVVTLKSGLLTYTWTTINLLFTVISIYIWYLFLIIYCKLFHWLRFEDSAMYTGADVRLLVHVGSWLQIVLVTVLALLRDFAVIAYKRNYNPSLVHSVQTFEASVLRDFDREDVKLEVPWQFPRHEVKQFKPSLSRLAMGVDSGPGMTTAELSTMHVFLPMHTPELSPGRRRTKISSILEDL